MEDLDIIELIIDENNLEDGIEAISLSSRKSCNRRKLCSFK